MPDDGVGAAESTADLFKRMSIVQEEQDGGLPHGGAASPSEGDSSGVQRPPASTQQVEKRILHQSPSYDCVCSVSGLGVALTGVGAASACVENQLARRLSRVRSELALPSFRVAREGSLGRMGVSTTAGEILSGTATSVPAPTPAAVIPTPGGLSVGAVPGEEEEARCGICLDAGDFIATAPCNHMLCGEWGHQAGSLTRVFPGSFPGSLCPHSFPLCQCDGIRTST